MSRLTSVFISYRRSDGTSLAQQVAALLRASGHRVWLDATDLGAGSIDQRIYKALKEASASVLIVTPDLANSDYVKDKEVPELIRRVVEDQLPMMVINTFRDPETGCLDVGKPDEIIRRVEGELGLSPSVEAKNDITLSRLAQGSIDDADARQSFVYNMLRIPAEEWRISELDRLSVLLQVGIGDAVPSKDLEIAIDDDSRGIPSVEALRALAVGLPELSRACQRAGVKCIDFHGKARISTSLAIGSQFTAQANFREVTVENAWGDTTVSDPKIHEIEVEDIGSGAGTDIVVIAPLIKQANELAIQRLLNSLSYKKAIRVTLKSLGDINPGEGIRLAGAIGKEIKQVTADADTNRVHLALMCPFPLAVLIGRELNRLSTVVHEYLDDERKYLPLMELSPSRGSGIVPLLTEPASFRELINLTPHEVRLLDEDKNLRACWPPAENWARLIENVVENDGIAINGDSLPSQRIRYGEPLGLPALQEGVGLIVSRVLAHQVGRRDLVFPGGEVRDEKGNILGCRRLDRFIQEV